MNNNLLYAAAANIHNNCASAKMILPLQKQQQRQQQHAPCVARRVSSDDPRLVLLQPISPQAHTNVVVQQPEIQSVPSTAAAAPVVMYSTGSAPAQPNGPARQVTPPSAHYLNLQQQQQQQRQQVATAAPVLARDPVIAPCHENNNHHRYMPLALQRASKSAPWGLAVSWITNCLVLQKVLRDDCTVRGYWLTESAVAPLDTVKKGFCVPNFLRQLLRTKAVASASSGQSAKTVLSPGDCIVAIAGRSVSEMGSLAACIECLRACGTAVQLVVYRPSNTVIPAVKVPPVPQRNLFGASSATALKAYVPYVHPKPVYPKNMLFTNPETGEKGIEYVDEHFEYDPDDEHRAHLFLKPLGNFATWLQQRKQMWRKMYVVREITEDWIQEEKDCVRTIPESFDRQDSTVAVDFWSAQGYSSHTQWLIARTANWKAGYSWNRRKRKALEHDCEEVVHLGNGDRKSFDDWLRVRKNQWKVQRRKRQRLLQQMELEEVEERKEDHETVACIYKPPPSQQHSELMVIDALLEDQEREQSLKESRPPLDISFLFDADSGCPDDIVTRIFRYLSPVEHGKFLCLNRETRRKLMKREELWRQLCPTHWKLPRRPRKPWHVIYSTNLRVETARCRKRWDDLLSRASSILLKADQLQTIEKIVTEAERDGKFHVDYVSGVVCERNSLLNLAVIHQRAKVVRWLVEVKDADIESSDRGNFTPLLNAAYAGDRYLVRFLMQKKADRSKIGTFHYTKPLSHPDFKGLTAEGWAEKKGYHDIAKLLRLGL